MSRSPESPAPRLLALVAALVLVAVSACSLRHTRTTRFAQLTFWDPPAPRLQE
jgi:hypothetical protein